MGAGLQIFVGTTNLNGINIPKAYIYGIGRINWTIFCAGFLYEQNTIKSYIETCLGKNAFGQSNCNEKVSP
jgi:hypothetical protein